MSKSSVSYPMWYCSVWGCDYRTEYAVNLIKHLKAHGFGHGRIKAELDLFWKAMSMCKGKGVSPVLVDKADDDPTKPRK
jgi:hypothetical protein